LAGLDVLLIDESKIGKRKYNKGRMVEGTWIFGMIDVTNNNVVSFRLEICEDNKRDAATLISLIKKHVVPGTLIRSDCWKSYDRLNEHACMKLLTILRTSSTQRVVRIRRQLNPVGDQSKEDLQEEVLKERKWLCIFVIIYSKKQ